MKLFFPIKNKFKSFKSLGLNVQLFNPTLSNPENIIIGNDVYIGPGAQLHGRGGIEIHNGVIIGPRVTIHSSNHNYENALLIPYDGTTILKRVVIEDNVWIGDNVMIVPGVTIGEGSVIGMGSVVTKDIPKYSICGGNPSKIIKINWIV